MGLLDREFLGIGLKYWLFAIACWILAAILVYLMFVFTSIEVDLALTMASTVLGMASIISLATAATRRDVQLLRQDIRELRRDIQALRSEVAGGFTRIENALRDILQELRRSSS